MINTLNIERAISELESCTESQWTNGMLPHIRFVKDQTGYSPNEKEWNVGNKTKRKTFQTSGITQPPVLAIALKKIIESKEYNDTFNNRVKTLAKEIDDFHTFLLTYRDPYSENLATIIHPWESGLDNLPIFDEVNNSAKDTLNHLNMPQAIKARKDINRVIAEFRPGEKDYEVYGKLISFFKHHNYDQLILAKTSPFRVQDVLFNSLLYDSLKSIEVVYKFLHKKTGQKVFKNLSKRSKAKADQVKEAILKKLYDKEKCEFYSYDTSESKLLQNNTIESLIASIYFKNDNPEKLFERYQDKNILSFLSTPDSEAGFNPVKYWRGPVWPITNWLIIQQLIEKNTPLWQKNTQKKP